MHTFGSTGVISILRKNISAVFSDGGSECSENPIQNKRERKVDSYLITQNLELGGNLWLMATGTGIAPFMSLLRDPNTYSDFDKIYVTWTTRTLAEQDSYRIMLEEAECEFIPTITREDFHTQGRITNLIKEGKVFKNATPEKDKVMLCGSMDFNNEMKEYLNERGWHEGNW